MNKKIEAVLNKNDANASDYFDLVNEFEYSELKVQKDGRTLFELSINYCNELPNITSCIINNEEVFHNIYELGQKSTDAHLAIQGSAIEAISGQWLEETDAFLTKADMTNGTTLSVISYNVNTNTKLENKEDFEEIDVISFNEYLNDRTHIAKMVKIRDPFGLVTKFDDIINCTMKEDSDGQFTVEILGGNKTSISFPLVDDSCNEVFINENKATDTILIHPYGQPFINITILVKK